MNKKAIFCLLFLSILFTATYISAEDYADIFEAAIPGDFKVVAVAGGVAPWTPINKVEIDAKGNGTYSIMPEEKRSEGIFTVVNKFKLEESGLRLIFEAVRMNNFFNLKESYISEATLDGSFAELTVTENKKAHKVRTQNMPVEAFDNIMIAINIATPKDNKVYYNEILR